LEIEGFGFTVIIYENGIPVQTPDLGVIKYVAVCGVFVELDNVPEILEAFVPEEPPVIPPLIFGADQLYVVPAGTIPFAPSEGEEEKFAPLHTTLLIVVIKGFGFTFMLSVKDAPEQVPEVGDIE
jgi:hypothetical protein